MVMPGSIERSSFIDQVTWRVQHEELDMMLSREQLHMYVFKAVYRLRRWLALSNSPSGTV